MTILEHHHAQDNGVKENDRLTQLSSIKLSPEETRTLLSLLKIVSLSDNKQLKKDIGDLLNIYFNNELDDEERTAAFNTLIDMTDPENCAKEIEDFLCDEGSLKILKKMEHQELHFADKLKALLEKKNITQKQLADKIHVGQSAISMMLKRQCRPQKHTIEKIAKALDASPKELWNDV